MTSRSAVNLTVALLVTVGGCNVEPETLQSLTDAVHPVSRGLEPSPAQRADRSVEPGWQAAHPDRVDPFSFPPDAPTPNEAASTSITSAQVEVLGFANIDEPRVILRTAETTRSLKVGQSTQGVEVVAIDAPTVQLRRGTLVWTASMFDNVPMAAE